MVYCLVAGDDGALKLTFAIAPLAGDATGASGRAALMEACNQMQANPSNVFGGRRVYFTEDPDIQVAYCLVRKPDAGDLPEVAVTDPRFVDTVELLFMSYYGEPLGISM
jgi:hypothetical protein